jgi:hypothetical protein
MSALVGEISAIIAIAGSVIGVLDTVISLYSRLKHATVNLERLRRVVFRLERQLAALEACSPQNLRIMHIHRDDQKLIKDTLRKCNQYLEDYTASLGTPRLFAKFQSERKIEMFRREIETIYVTIISPLWPPVLYNR